MEGNKRERTSTKASQHWSRLGLPPILSWTSCKWAFGHSGWAVKWAPHEACWPLPYVMLGIDTEVPCPHCPHGPVTGQSFVHDLIIYRCAQKECVRTNSAVKTRLYLNEDWEWTVCTLKWVAENYIVCLHAGKNITYVLLDVAWKRMSLRKCPFFAGVKLCHLFCLAWYAIFLFV